jgi:hypothetical protein
MHSISRFPQDIPTGGTNRDCVFVDGICRYCFPWQQRRIVRRKCECWSQPIKDEYHSGREDTERIHCVSVGPSKTVTQAMASPPDFSIMEYSSFSIAQDTLHHRASCTLLIYTSLRTPGHIDGQHEVCLASTDETAEDVSTWWSKPHSHRNIFKRREKDPTCIAPTRAPFNKHGEEKDRIILKRTLPQELFDTKSNQYNT